MSPRILLLALSPVLLAASEPEDADPLAGAQTVSDEVLAAQRGGFAFQGMVIAFGADIRSYVNDELALRTIVSWTPEGQTIERFVSPALRRQHLVRHGPRACQRIVIPRFACREEHGREREQEDAWGHGFSHFTVPTRTSSRICGVS